MKITFTRFYLLSLVLMMQFTFAQERTVTGVVLDDTGLPLPGASVLVKETKSGTQTNLDGQFTINVAPNQTLIFSYIGMKTQEIKASSTTLSVKLTSDSVELENVVVTAFGIKKQKKSLGYATATVSSKDLTEVNNTNVFESLSGKVAGVDISAPAQVGASSKVIIRGYNSLSAGASSPLYIIDGTPINNNNSSSPTYNTKDGTQSTRSFDGGNGIGDIDPNNIESMTILKGAAASALYGSRAGSGVIIITTKSGKKNSKINVELSTSLDFSEVARIAHLQNEFGQGWDGKSWSNNQPGNNASNENGSWGPAFNGEIRPWGSIINNSQQIKPYVALKNNIRDFYETGNTYTNNVRLSGGGENSNFSLNYSDVNSDGVIPTKADSYSRKTLSFNGGIDDKKISFKANFNYVKKDQNAVNTGQGDNAGEGNTLAQEILQTPRDISIVDLKDYLNNPFNNNSYFYTPYASNPYWVTNENSTHIDGNRFYGNINLTYNFNKKLSLSYQSGGDYQVEKIKSYGAVVNFLPNSPQDLAGTLPIVGGVTESTIENVQFDTNLILNYNTSFKDDFKVNALIGFNNNERKNYLLQSRITNLDILGYYEISNSSVKPRVIQDDSKRRSYSIFTSIETSYQDKLFLTITGRNDWTSTLPQKSNSYFYPSINLSGIVIDDADTFLKLRTGFAQIANDTSPYQTSSSLTQGRTYLGFGYINLPIGGVNGYELSDNLGNSDLKPEITTEIELGFETSLLSKRVYLDFSYYQKTTKDLLYQRPLPTSTGFSSQTSNILDVTNKGVEIVLSVIPIKIKDFNWEYTTTFTKNNSNVTDIKGGQDKIQLATNYGVSFNAIKGQPLGVFNTFIPKTTESGQYIVDANTGFYKVTEDEQNIGTSQRDFIMGFKNKFSYKNITLSFGVDWKQGGKMYSYTKHLAEFTGVGIETTYNNRSNFIIPNSVVEVTDTDGNVTGYEENTTAIYGINNPENPTGDVTNYWTENKNPGIERNHVIDKTFVRLRDISLTYNIPVKMLKNIGITNASFSIYGKNLALWTPGSNPYVDPELSTYGDGLLSEQGEFGTNPSQRSFGANLKLTF